MITLEEIKKCGILISDYIHKTPVLSSTSINNMFESEFLFKCENFQKGGSFKIRGATNSLLSTPLEKLQNGVVTHSSGNHAQALSLAAKKMNIPAYIVMPENSSIVKVNAVKSYGGEVIFCEPNLQSRERTAHEIMSKTNAEFIHPYDNINTIKGQSTVLQEVIDYGYDFNTVLAPVGGGGLLSGTALSAYYADRNIRTIGAEPENANDAFVSFKTKKHTPVKNPDTIADGLRTSLGKLNFGIIKEYVNDILMCKEESIIKAMRIISERLKIVVEPSGAVPLACIIDNSAFFKNKKVLIIISGGNIDLSRFSFYPTK